MKSLITLALVVVAGFLFYKYVFPSLWNKGAFDKNGNPTVIVFTWDGCGDSCARIATTLKERNITFEEVNTLSDEGQDRFKKFGGDAMPLTVIGKNKILGDNILEIENALTETYGMSILTPYEQEAMKRHFDENGNPKVVMYGTSWCPKTKRLREYLVSHNIPFTDYDVERDSEGTWSYGILKGSGYPTGYPTTFVGYRKIIGHDEQRISKALDELLPGKP